MPQHANAPARETGAAPAAPRELTAREYLRLARMEPWRMLSLGGRLRSLDVLEYLASAATRDACDWAGLLAAIESGAFRERLGRWRAPHLVCATLLAAVLSPEPRHFEAAAAVLHAVPGESRLWTQGAAYPLRLAAQIAALTDSHALFQELARLPFLAPGVAWAGETDLLRPQTDAEWGRTGAPAAAIDQFGRWWGAFNAPFTEHGLAPYRLDPDRVDVPERLFAAIEAPAVPPAATPLDEQPLVTVIVPTYAPDAGFLRTVDSLTRQSWANLEVLIVDDCSPSGHEFLEAAAASDPRVRVIRMASNGGAYRARDRGLAEARGEFVTFQDADDLSHTRRVELQVLPLLRDAARVASVSRAQRVLSDGTLTYFGYLPHRVNASSLLFRRGPVLVLLGRFDAVRKGADSEFTERLIAAFGAEALVELAEPLSLVQLTLGSLSRSDFRPFWMSGNRLAYMRQFGAAHRRIAAAPEPDWALSETRPAICRSAPAMRGAAPPAAWAVAVVSDWNDTLAAHRDPVALVRSLARGADAPVGLLNGVHPRFSSMARAQIPAEVADLVEEGTAAWMNWGDPARVGTLVIDGPELLWALPRPEELGVAPDRVEIVLDELLRRTDAPALPPVAWCEERVLERFGVRPSWRASSPVVRARLRELGAAVEPAPDGPAVTAAPRRRSERATFGVVWPARADQAGWELGRVLDMLPDPGTAETVVYDAAGVLDEREVGAPGLRLMGPDDGGRDAFLARIDFLLPDLFGQRLLGTESWIRRLAGTGVRLLLPAGLETVQPAHPLRYPPGAAREVLAALALDPAFEPLDPAFEPLEAEPPLPPAGPSARMRFVILPSDDPVQFAATERSVREAAGGDRADVRRLGGGRLRDLLAPEVLGGLRADDRVCVLPAGARFEPDAFDALEDGDGEDVHVFREAGYDYALNGGLAGRRAVVARGGAPLWAGATATLVRADVLAAAAGRCPDAAVRGLLFAAAVAVSGGFGVLGGVVSPGVLEDRADEDPDSLTLPWYEDLARDWAGLLEDTAELGPAHDYLQEVFVYLLSARMRLNSGPGQKLSLSDEAYARYAQLLGRALRTVDDARLWRPRRPGRIPSATVRRELLSLKLGDAFRPAPAVDEGGPRTDWGELELERPANVPVTVDAMHARDGVLTIRGRLPLVFDYPGAVLVLRTGDLVLALEDRGRYADGLLHGRRLRRAFTFDAEVPLDRLGDRLEFRYEGAGFSLPLRLYFARAAAKLSAKPGAYWAIGRSAILAPVDRGIAVAPATRARVALAELRRQRALRGSGDPVQRAAARLRLRYFLSRRRFAGRRIWMYADRIVKGGDNGEYAFAYAEGQRDGIEKHYVLGRGTALERRFAERGLRFLSYGTDEQRLHYLNAEVVFATRLSPTDTFGFPDDQHHFRDLFGARLVYINHGLVVDRLDYVLNAGYTDFDRVCVVSETERRNLLTPSYGYRPEQVEVTGFARYDGLVSSSERTLLLAPTWRAYLHQPQQGDRQSAGHRAFRRTAYFRVFDSLIRSPRLREALRRHDFRLLFLLHPNASSQVTDFGSDDPRVEVRAATSDVSYEELLTSAALMITDYSGVQFDFAQMRKPVVYYQPDSIPPHYREDSFDYERDAFGEVTRTEDELVAVLEAYLRRECALDPRFERRIESFFGHLDRRNAERIYRVGLELAPEPREEPRRG